MEIISKIDMDSAYFFASFPKDGAVCAVMRIISRAGDYGLVWLLLGVILCLPGKRRFSGACLFLSMLLCFVVCNLTLKPLVNRPRPFDMYPWITPLLIPEDGFSFPSGHAASSFAAACAMFMTLPRRWGFPALALAAAIAASRLFMRVHFLTDVVCGAIIGFMCAALSVFLLRALLRSCRHFPRRL